MANWQAPMLGEPRVRLADYTHGHLVEHWCYMGHILLCLEGERHTALKDGGVS